MKTETKIAEENIKEYKEWLNLTPDIFRFNYCKRHKASCERFLEFLEDWEDCRSGNDCFPCGSCLVKITERLIDLRNAIKKYVEAGI